MQPLNAIDAISPAFRRTHQVLFQPFKLGRSWKLAAAQYLGLMGAFFIPFPLFLAFVPARGIDLGIARAALLGVLSIFTLVAFCFYYVGVRMQFVNFEMIVTGERSIAPMWRRYGVRVWPVIWLKAFAGTALSLLMMPLLYRTGVRLFHAALTLPAAQPGQQIDPASFQMFFASILGFEAIFFCAFLVLKAFSTLFEDFVQPFYILENMSLGTALRRGGAVFGAEPLQCLLYLLMKLVLSVVGFMAQYVGNLIVVIPALIVGLIAAAIGTGLHSALHLGDSGDLLLVAGAVLLYIVLVVALIWYQIGALGYLSAFLEAYGIYFLGGRYALLGDMLEPPAQAAYVFTPPPAPPVLDADDDEDDGPSLPMNPALA